MGNLKERLKAFYADYSAYILPVVKFALALILYVLINNRLGYLGALNKLYVLVILAAISAILPFNGTVLIGISLIVAHCFGLGVETGMFALVLYLVMVLLYFRFVPRDALVMLLTPLAGMLHLEAAVPLCLGLVRGPESALSAVCGLVSWQYVEIVHGEIAPLKEADAGMLNVLQSIPASLFSTKLLLCVIAAAAATVLVAIIVRHMTTYTRLRAVIAGAVLYLVIMFAGGAASGVDLNYLQVIVGTVAAAAIALMLNFFVYSVDYRQSRFIQFEDDDYYYYVKAIPKIRAGGAKPVRYYDDSSSRREGNGAPVDGSDVDGVDFKTKLEDSLKDL
jgi:hypothetical protein